MLGRSGSVVAFLPYDKKCEGRRLPCLLSKAKKLTTIAWTVIVVPSFQRYLLHSGRSIPRYGYLQFVLLFYDKNFKKDNLIIKKIINLEFSIKKKKNN